MGNEIWKDIKGYEGKYQVSNLGNVKSLLTNKIMKNHLEKNGYYRIFLSNGKRGNQTKFSIHRLVGIAFIENRENKPQINHKNGIKTDNRLENLEWCTGSENIKHSVKNGLKPTTKYWTGKFGKDNKNSKKVGQYKDNILLNTYYGISEAGRLLGLDVSDISRVCLGKKKHLKGFIFKYI